MQQILDENRHSTRTATMENTYAEMQDAVRNLRRQNGLVQAELNRIGGLTGSSAGGGGRARSLVDPKNMTLRAADTDKDPRSVFEEWRDDLEDYVEESHVNLKPVLQKVARWRNEVDENEFRSILQGLSLDVNGLHWTYETVSRELKTFIKKYIQGRGRKAFSASQL